MALSQLVRCMLLPYCSKNGAFSQLKQLICFLCSIVSKIWVYEICKSLHLRSVTSASEGKHQWSSKPWRILPVGTMNVCPRFYGNQTNSCWWCSSPTNTLPIREPGYVLLVGVVFLHACLFVLSLAIFCLLANLKTLQAPLSVEKVLLDLRSQKHFQSYEKALKMNEDWAQKGRSARFHFLKSWHFTDTPFHQTVSICKSHIKATLRWMTLTATSLWAGMTHLSAPPRKSHWHTHTQT